jgi:hypothetical protein
MSDQFGTLGPIQKVDNHQELPQDEFLHRILELELNGKIIMKKTMALRFPDL